MTSPSEIFLRRGELPRPPKGSQKWTPKKDPPPLLHLFGEARIIKGLHLLDPLEGPGTPWHSQGFGACDVRGSILLACSASSLA